MLRVLLKKQLSEIFRGFFYNPKTNRAKSRSATIGCLIAFNLLIFGLLGGMFAFLAVGICGPLTSAGLGWMYFALLALIAVALGTFGSVFNTYAGLYLAKDNDLLLSMPIPVRIIMISRLLGVYLMGLLYSGTVMLPGVIVYYIMGNPSPLSVIGALLLTLLVTVIVFLLSCLLGWVIAKISVRLKNKSFITVLISLVFLGIYYFVYFRAQRVIAALLANPDAWGARLRAVYPVYLLGRAGEGDPLAMVVSTAVIAALSALLLWRMARTFLRIATSSGGSAKAVYREKTVRMKSPARAMLGKEFARFTGSPSYMLNCGLGLVFLVAAAVALLFRGNALISLLKAEGMGDLVDAFPAFFCGALGIMVGMVDITSPSVSLEGKNIWLAQSLPVTPWICLRAKLLVQILLASPVTLLCSVAGLIVLRPDPIGGILMVLIPQAVVLFQAVFGLMLNLLRPSLNWSNEIYPIKQSMSVFLALFAGMLIGVLPILAVIFFGAFLGTNACLLIYGIFIVAAAIGITAWLRSRGSKIFANL